MNIIIQPNLKSTDLCNKCFCLFFCSWSCRESLNREVKHLNVFGQVCTTRGIPKFYAHYGIFSAYCIHVILQVVENIQNHKYTVVKTGSFLNGFKIQTQCTCISDCVLNEEDNRLRTCIWFHQSQKYFIYSESKLNILNENCYVYTCSLLSNVVHCKHFH